MADIHQSMFDNLIACRDQLEFTLTDQFEPPEEIAAPMWELHGLLDQKIEELKRETGFVEPNLTIYAPKRA
jgi:hypothetical protein